MSLNPITLPSVATTFSVQFRGKVQVPPSMHPQATEESVRCGTKRARMYSARYSNVLS